MLITTGRLWPLPTERVVVTEPTEPPDIVRPEEPMERTVEACEPLGLVTPEEIPAPVDIVRPEVPRRVLVVPT